MSVDNILIRISALGVYLVFELFGGRIFEVGAYPLFTIFSQTFFHQQNKEEKTLQAHPQGHLEYFAK